MKKIARLTKKSKSNISKMSKQLEKLKRKARRAITVRGHIVGPFSFGSRKVAGTLYSYCVHCNMQVCVNKKDVSGTAVVFDCKSGAIPS